MYIDNAAGLPILDYAAKVSAAKFLLGISKKQKWKLFVECWF